MFEPQPLEIDQPAAPSMRVRLLRFLGELIQTALIALILFIVVNLVTARIRVEGISMEPSLHDGEFVVVNRLAYRWLEPKRGDVVVFYFPLDPSRRFIKRIIGLPGDQVAIRDGQVFVNDLLIEEPYIASTTQYDGEWEINPYEIFVLGDNRNNSSDSHRWGPLPMNEVIGKAVLVYWPPDSVGMIPHYELNGELNK